MKFIVFNVREDEKQAFATYQEKHPEMTLHLYEDALTLESAQLIDDSYDAIIVSQVKEIPDEVYHHIKNCGIQVFSTRSAGFDMYKLALLKNLNIRLTRVPVYSPNAIAEYAVSGTMYFSRQFDVIQSNVKQYDFRWQGQIVSEELRHKTVGIIGTGNIGRQTAQLFKGLGATVIGFDVYQNEDAKQLLTYVEDVETLVKNSDVISLHAPATPENYHLFNADMFALMKPNAILVNTARGSLIDTKAMLTALDNKQFRAAVLDVYENEGPYVNKVNAKDAITDEVFLNLLERQDVLYSPHIAFYTHTAIENLVHIALDGARKIVLNEACKEEVIL